MANVLSGLADLSVGIAGLTGAFDPKAPEMLDFAQLYKDAIKGQIESLPQQFKSKKLFDPLFAALEQRLAFQNMFGYPERTWQQPYEEKVTKPGATLFAPYGGKIPAGVINVREDKEKKGYYYTFPDEYEMVTKHKPVKLPRTPGMLEIWGKLAPSVQKIQQELTTSLRRGELQDVRELGPEAYAAMKASDPMAYNLYQRLQEQAMQGLDSPLTEAERREVGQSVRSGQAARGLGYGKTDIFEEAMGLGNAARMKQRENQAFAAQVFGMRPDPFRLVLNRSSGQEFSPYALVNPYQSQVLNQPNPAAFGIAQGNQQLDYGHSLNLSNIAMQSANQTAQGAANVVGGLATMGIG